jgi:hypothetical protein
MIPPMRKVQALIIGGDADRNINKKVRELIDFDLIPSGKEVQKHKFQGKQIVIVLARWVSSQQAVTARKIATQLGVPIATTLTGNHIPGVLEKFGLTPKEQPKAAEPTPPPVTVPVRENTTTDPDSMDTDDLWKIYGQTAREIIEGLMVPGDKQDTSTLLDLLSGSDGLNISKASCERLLGEMHTRWRLINTVGTTWKLLGPEEEYVEDLEPVTVQPKAAEPEEPESEERKIRAHGGMDELVMKMAGLPCGPYRMVKDFYAETLRYTDFLKLDGSEPTRSYIDLLRKRAVKAGIVEDRADGLWVNTDKDIVLTPRTGYKPVVKQGKIKKAAKVATPEPEPEASPAIDYAQKPKYVSLQEFAGEQPKKVETPDRTASLLREAYGGEIPWHGEHTATVRKLRSLLPIECWDEMAARTAVKKLFPKESRSWRDFIAVGKALENKEWDFLAWETLKDMPLHVLAPWLRDKPEDMHLRCRDCGKEFVFSVAEQDYLERQFGQVIPAKSCRECRARRRA